MELPRRLLAADVKFVRACSFLRLGVSQGSQGVEGLGLRVSGVRFSVLGSQVCGVEFIRDLVCQGAPTSILG